MIHLDKNEHIESIIRKHWFILLRDTVGLVIIFIIPLIVYYYFSGTQISLSSAFNFSLETIDPTILLFATAAWSLIIWAKLAGVWTDYYLDAWVITEKRIIDIEQRGLFHRQTSVIRMERIQDITIETKGIIATLLNFGDIHVQSAGETREFVIRGISKPRKARGIILKHSDNIIGENDSSAMK